MGVPEKLAENMSMAEQHEYLRAKFSRRNMIRGGAVTLGAVAGGAFVPGAVAQAAVPTRSTAPQAEKVDGALVAPFGRHLAFGNDPRTEITVSWQVPTAVKKPYIRIGAHPWDLSRKIEAEVRTLYTPAGVGVSGDHTQYYLHAKLTHLRPGKTYYYGVGHAGFDPAASHLLGTLGTFTTAPDRSEPFTFTAFGDEGVGYHGLANDALLLGQNPAFHLHAGDIAYADPSGAGKTEDTGFDSRIWDQFLAQTETVAKQVPWMPAYGNHDMEAWYSPNGYGGEEARWSLPDNGPDAKNLPGVYSFVYGNTAVISLDANDISFEIPANLGISGGTQTKWLEGQLKKFRASRDVDFVVVFFHHCAYCTSGARLGGGRATGVGAAVREVHGGPGDQRPQPPVRAHGRHQGQQGHQEAADRRHRVPGDRRCRVRDGGCGRTQPVRVHRGGVVRGSRERGRLGRLLHQPEGRQAERDGRLVAGALPQLLVPARGRHPRVEGRLTTLTVRGIAETGAEVDHFTVARRAK